MERVGSHTRASPGRAYRRSSGDRGQRTMPALSSGLRARSGRWSAACCRRLSSPL